MGDALERRVTTGNMVRLGNGARALHFSVLFSDSNVNDAFDAEHVRRRRVKGSEVRVS